MSRTMHLIKIGANTPIGKEGKTLKPRQADLSHFGMICPSETPDGATIGLVGNFALLCHVSRFQSSTHLMDLVWKHTKPLRDCTPNEISSLYRVFVNGKWIGMTKQGRELANFLISAKRSLDISFQTGIYIKRKERSLFIKTDAGRVMRPLLIVKNNCIVLTPARLDSFRGISSPTSSDSIMSLMAEGLIELVDVEEEDNLLIAMYPDEVYPENPLKFTHCELHPATIYGEIVGSIPYSNHTPPTRNTFEAAMAKSTIGVPFLNSEKRMDSGGSQSLYYPQKPITKTKISKMTGGEEMPGGMEAVVMIACMHGENTEVDLYLVILKQLKDALIISQGSVDRGLGRSSTWRTIRDQEQKLGSFHTEQFGIPDPQKTHAYKVNSNYSKLEEDGLIGVGEHVYPDDIVVGKTSSYISPTGKSNFSFKDQSISTKEEGRIDKVMLTTNVDGFPLVKIKSRYVRTPIVGDKYTSRHGQKGIIGRVVPEEDMPFSVKSGIRPDIIINPHAKPSRMTIGMILEMMAGKISCTTGEELDATPFEHCLRKDCDIPLRRQLEKKMKELGYAPGGEEKFINGETGEMFDALFFIGTCYIQKLKHMVMDKLHARFKGNVVMRTRQPVEGRCKDGGLRFGEMERDCVIAYGAANVLNSRMMKMSDITSVYVCETCGNWGYRNPRRDTYHCNKCDDEHARLRYTEIPYVLKLLTQELNCMGIKTEVRLKKDEPIFKELEIEAF